MVCVLLLSLGVSGCGGTAVDPNAGAAMEWVRKLDGEATVITVSGAEAPGKNVPAEKIARLHRIDLNSRPVTDEHLEEMPALQQLQHLGLYRTQITDRGIEHLKKIGKLTELELSYTNITEAGLAQLVLFKDLKKLFLHGTGLSKEAIQDFQRKRPDCTVINSGV